MNLELEWNEPCLQVIPVGQAQSWYIEYQPAGEMVVLTAYGRIFREDARRQAEQVAQLMRRHKTQRVLADFRGACVEISLPDIYWLPAHYATLTAFRRFRIAVVATATGHRMDSFTFYEVRCANAGFNVKLFVDPADAGQWLQQTSLS